MGFLMAIYCIPLQNGKTNKKRSACLVFQQKQNPRKYSSTNSLRGTGNSHQGIGIWQQKETKEKQPKTAVPVTKPATITGNKWFRTYPQSYPPEAKSQTPSTSGWEFLMVGRALVNFLAFSRLQYEMLWDASEKCLKWGSGALANVAKTKYCGLGGLSIEIIFCLLVGLFFMVLEASSPRSRYQLGWWWLSSWLVGWATFLVSLHCWAREKERERRREGELSGVSYNDTNLIIMAFCSWIFLNLIMYLYNALSPNTTT